MSLDVNVTPGSPHLAGSESLARTQTVAQGTRRGGCGLLLEKILECQQNAKQLDLVKFVRVGFESNADLSIFEDQQSQMYEPSPKYAPAQDNRFLRKCGY
ncbi:hypothetical protein V9T40_001053 [Parthenolecanium corni]|uniref:Uncharacterized protein n=1 Tax=Parthenolecanium corni TaxID=536013 RepID=A0AAN9Y102_9HEMI